MSEYTFIEFNVSDYKNENVLSSYALEQTPLTFVPKLSNIDYVDVLWDFGDNTFSRSLTASKYYTTPGKYLVNFTVYDCYSKAIISTDSKVVHIINYIDHTFKVDFENPTYYDSISWKNGKINGPILIKTYYPPTETPTSIFYRISGSKSEYYFNDIPDKFRHLDRTYSFFEKIYNYHLKSYQFSEIDRIDVNTTPIYARIENNNLNICKENDSGSFFVGLSGEKEVWFKDDTINRINIDLFFDKNKQAEKGSNTLKISLSANIVDNDDDKHLSITSNGLDGEYYIINSFNIDRYKFANVDIPFVIKIKDEENFTVKNFTYLDIYMPSYYILSGGEIINDLYLDLIETPGVFPPSSVRGAIRFRNTEKLHNIQLSAVIAMYNDQGVFYTMGGATSQFDVYPQDFLTIEKKNEDFDAKETFKGLRFQEFLLDKEVLFEDFMGSIFGTLSSSYDTLGKKIYEKITNFVENIQDVDRNEIFSLISQMKMMGTENDVFNSSLFTYPEKIKRLLDLGSISKNKLLGYENKFKENFDHKGFTTKEIYGKNLGNEIYTDTYMVSAGIPVVALEKFSNKYALLNTEQPLERINSVEYDLIYSVDNLILDKDPTTTVQLYLTAGGLGAYVPRNPNCFLANFDTTGWASSFPGSWPAIALTSRHVSFPWHWIPPGTQPPVGGQFWFYDMDGNRVIRTVVDRLRVGTSDIMVVLLNADLPANISPVRIASPEIFERLDWSGGFDRIPMVFHKQLYGRVGVMDLIKNTYSHSLSASWYGTPPINPNRNSFYTIADIGDSGNPLSFIYNNDVILVGFYTGYFNGPRFAYYIDAIHNTIDTINTTNGVAGTYRMNVVYPREIQNTYPLSAYNSNWGWPMVLPSDYRYSELSKYYTFFEYIDGYDSTISDNTIIYDNTIYSTLTAENVLLDENGNIITNEVNEPLYIEFEYEYVNYLLNVTLRDTLYQSLSLIQPS